MEELSRIWIDFHDRCTYAMAVDALEQLGKLALTELRDLCMPPNKQTLECDIENEIVTYCLSRGGLPLKLALKGQRGFPDRTILLPGGRVVFVEIKRPGGKHKAQQPIWLERLRSLGFVAETVYSVEDVQRIVG